MTSSTSNNRSASASVGGADQLDFLTPTEAAAGEAHWRRALAHQVGGDLGGELDEPRRRLTLLKIFGSTRRLAEIALKDPMTTAEAVVNGPTQVIGEAVRDLADLDGGVGGPDVLHDALAPLAARVDLCASIAELSGEWTPAEAGEARASFAARLIEASLAWLMRSAVARGELPDDLTPNAGSGVFVLGGGDFAHDDLGPLSAVDIAVIYDQTRFAGANATMVERSFVRLGTELRDVFEGKGCEARLFSLRTPLGSGLHGAGLVESAARASAALGDEQKIEFRAFLAGAKPIAGDRQAGGAFLEEAEEAVWVSGRGPGAYLDGELSDDVWRAYEQLAAHLRFGFGGERPFFRTAPARELFLRAAEIGALTPALASRLASGDALLKAHRARAAMISAEATARSADEERALAYLCGYDAYEDLQCLVRAAFADARAAFPLLCDGPLWEFGRYRAADGAHGDAQKLEGLGFANGASLSEIVDQWAGRGAYQKNVRFSALAPGLLSAFGQTQHPEQAVRIFDDMTTDEEARKAVFSIVSKDSVVRAGLIDAIGCFGAAVEPLTTSADGIAAMTKLGGPETPQNGEEWLARSAPPGKEASADEIAQWRRGNIALIAAKAASGMMGFGAATSALEAVQDATLKALFTLVGQDHDAPGLALHVFDGPSRGLPGEACLYGFIATDGSSQSHENFASAFGTVLENLDRDYFALKGDANHRPGGVAGALAPDARAYRTYMQSEAIAYDQVLLARARVVAGDDEAQKAADNLLRSAVSNPRRADILFRDLDRARAQRQRREPASSEWDLMRLSGGLSDVALIISALIYRHAGALPAARQANPMDALDALARAGRVSQETAGILKSAWGFWTRLRAAQALAAWSDPVEEPVRARFAALLAHAAEIESYAQIRPLMRGYAEEINSIYAQLVLGRPATHLAAAYA